MTHAEEWWEGLSPTQKDEIWTRCAWEAGSTPTDTQRLDWLEQTLVHLHRQGPYMNGCNVGGQLENKARNDRGLAGLSYFKVHHRSIRAAIDAAMEWPENNRCGH